MNAQGMILIGAGLTLLARLFGGSLSRGSFGAWQSPPSWAQALFGARGNRVFADDAIIETVGLLWLAGGGALLLAGQSPESAAFAAVETVLVACFFVGGIGALAIWFVREYVRR